MSDTTTAPAATAPHQEGEAQPETPQPEATLADLKSELRDAGEAGKKQWQEAFARTREALTATRAGFERVVTRTRDVASSTCGRAEARGAQMLLRLVSQVRAGAEAFEGSLRERAAATPEPAASVDAQALTA